MVLRRSYLDIFLSWKARGLFHRINQDVANRPGAVDRILVDAVLQLEEPPIKQIFLVHNSQRIDQKNYPLRQAIDDLLVLFYNDLKILELSRKVDLSLPIDYPDISTRFEELIRFVGSRASAAEAQRVLAAPAMSRLGSLGGNLVHPSGVLEAFAACLDAAFRQQAARCGSADEMWAWENDGESFVINVPGLRDLLATYSVLDSSLPAVANTRHWGAVRWAPLNPIYGASH